MKQIYKLLALVAFIAAFVPCARAAEWSYDWPVNASADKANGYAGGFYNFGTTLDPDITSIERTLNGMAWKLSFDKGTKLTYLASSGQAVGAKGGFSSYFSLSSSAFSGKIKKVSVTTRTKEADAMLTVSVNGKAYKCGDATEVCYTVSSGTTPVEYTFTPGADGEQEGEILMYFTIPGAANNAYVKKVVVEYEEVVSGVAAPVFSPEAGTFDEPVAVAITGPEGAEILYTTDGSNPRAEGNTAVKVYDGTAVTIAETSVLKAVAKVGNEFSAVTEGEYVVRATPGIKLYGKTEFTIELLEEDLIMIDNPNKVEPIKYVSSNPQVAWADNYGHIYTYSVGETEITVTFAGNDRYLPQSISVPVKVIAKEPLAGLTVSPGEGTYSDLTEVTVECTDPRAVTLWYYIGDKAMGVDDLGMLEEFTINPSTKMTLQLDHSCVLTVQAVGNNVWSLPQVVNYTINMPLKAKFEAGDTYATIYRNGFDSEEEANEWNHSDGSNWQLTSATGFQGLPPFSSINPDSKYSLFHRYANTNDVSVVTSPDMVVPEGGQVRFYAAFNPVWIYDGNLMLYVCENVDGATPVKIWDAFLASQEAATDDIKWNQYSVDLAEYVGKEVYFAFAYELTNGDNVLIDDFELVAPKEDVSVVTVSTGEPVAFRDLSSGQPEAWEWQFPGAATETSAEQNPVVVYETPGSYDVTLTVRKGDESNTVTRAKYVVVRSVAPTAAIGVPSGVYYSPEAGLVVPLNTPLTFTDASKGNPTEYVWKLPGTDLKSSAEKDVTVKYVEEGQFDVDLAVSNDAGTSTTYIYGVKAGGESLAWNISAAENGDLGILQLGWYGNYGGTNWLGMEAFAEAFEKPAAAVTISGVNVYFASVTAVSTDAEITVSIAKADENGLPGEVLATAKLPVSELVDASETYNDPTEFVFSKPVKIADAFFVAIGGFPNASSSAGEDNIAMYALRRDPSGRNTAYHLLENQDDMGNPTGGSTWYAQEEDKCSFAIAPKLVFDNPSSGVEAVGEATEEGPVTYYNLQGIRVDAENLAPGIYIRRQGSVSTKVRL